VRAVIAWCVVALTATAVTFDTLFTAAHRPLLSEATWAEHGWPLAPLAGLVSAVMGALIISRYPRHNLGWLLCAASLLSVTLAADAYTLWVLEGDGPGSAYWAHVISWASPLLGWPAFAALILIFLISPTGHLSSPRWRWAVWITLVGVALRTLGTFTTRPGTFVAADQYDGFNLSTVLLTAGYLCVAAGLVASAVSLVLRLRRVTDDERRQLLWVTSSAVFLAIGVVVVLTVPRITGEEGTWLAGLPLKLAQLTVPLCVAVAVLRHRLLQIELIVNRALLLGLATVLTGVGYVLVVVVVGSVLGGGAGGFWPSLLATALVALGFQPLRRRVVRLADRVAFGKAAAPYEALSDFSRRLGERPDPTVLLPVVAEAAARAVNARRATASLHDVPGARPSASWPAVESGGSATAPIEIPVVDEGERLGTILVEMAAGHPLRAADRRLLRDVADQAALACRNAQLTAQLSTQVEQLDRQARDLEASRERLISVGDAERSRVERAIARQVMPHLTPLPARLRQLSSGYRNGAASLGHAEVEALLVSLNSAMEALREITRGVFPAQLTRSGLATALGSLLARPEHRGELTIDESAQRVRFDPRVEAATYFCVAEATLAFDPPMAVRLSVRGNQLLLEVSGNVSGQVELDHMRDRIEATSGSLTITQRDDRTVIEVSAPCAAASVQLAPV
jgi:signal transduction histidine kinase